MAEEINNQDIQDVEIEKNEKIRLVIDKMKNKKSNFLFFMPAVSNPAASVYEIYFNALTVKKLGYNVIILTDTNNYEIPEWIESELTDFEHRSMEQARLTVGPEDCLVIPEIFSNIMEQTKHLPCIRVGFLQAVDYMVNALIPATDWSVFGIKNVLTTSENLKEFVDEFYGKNKFKVGTYSPAIPPYFNYNGEAKRPVISVVGRNPNEISKVIKLFYSRYPQYTWVTFDSMITDSKPPKALTREDYADRLRKNFAVVWVDKISSFGTLPLEAMASGTIVIGIIPDITPEYLLEKNENGSDVFVNDCGVWTNDLYALPILIGDTLTKFIDDSIQDGVYDKMKEISSKYTVEQATEQLSKYYQGLIDERIEALEKALGAEPQETKE